MLFKPVAFAAAAAAFLLVPQIPPADEEAFKSLPIHVPEAEHAGAAAGLLQPHDLLLAQTLQVPCKQCRGRDTNLKLDFSIEDGKKLLLNDFELYPNADPWHGDLLITAVRADGREKKQRLGYSLLIVPRAFDEEQQLELIDVNFRVIEVGHRFVNQVPTVKLSLVKTTTGEIVMGNVQLVEAAQDSCAGAWCRVKAALEHALSKVKGYGGCGKFQAHGPGHGHAHGHGHGGSNKVEGGHRHHDAKPFHLSKSHSWARLLKNVISHILLPVLIGVAAGVGVAFLGIFVCGLVYRLVSLFRGRLPAAHAAACPSGRVTSRSLTADAEKERLMADEEAQDAELPPYTDNVKR